MAQKYVENDVVLVRPSAPPEARPGAKAWILHWAPRAEPYWAKLLAALPPGDVYRIQFEDEEVVYVLEDHLEPFPGATEADREFARIRNLSAALKYAADYDDLENALELLEGGGDPRHQQGHPLIVAIQSPSPRVTLAMIRHGADVNGLYESNAGRFQGTTTTPLLHAIKCGDPTVVYMLLAAGADPNLCGSEGVKPLVVVDTIRAGEEAKTAIRDALIAAGGKR